MTDLVKIAMIVTTPPTLTALAAVMVSLFNRKLAAQTVTKLGEVETRMDGRLDELLALTRTESFAAGRKEEKDFPGQ